MNKLFMSDLILQRQLATIGVEQRVIRPPTEIDLSSNKTWQISKTVRVKQIVIRVASTPCVFRKNLMAGTSFTSNGGVC